MILPILALLIQAQDAKQHEIKGPGLACGNAFAIDLRPGESLAWNDPGMDFIVYEFVRPDGGTVIYAGNFPQEGGVVTETGLGWPAKIVVHGTVDIAKRLHFDKQTLSRCPAAGGSKQ